MKSFVAVSLAVVLGLCSVAAASPFAATVESYNTGTSGYNPYYTDPTVVLGAPPTITTNFTSDWSGTYPGAVNMLNPVWAGPAGNPQELTIGTGGSLIVGFDHQVLNNSANPYGIAFQIFTNASFNGLPPDYNTTIANGSMAFGQLGQIRVSQDKTTWYTVDPTKLGTTFPMQAYLSGDPTAQDDGAALSNFTLPVDPTTQLSQFAGLTVEQALALYGGSAGGLGIDLNDLIDPVTGQSTNLPWIKYVEIDGPTSALVGFADTSVPEPATLGLAALGLAGLLSRRKKG